jgi:hypothetical protein
MKTACSLWLLALAACAPDDPTELVVVVDTDLGVPAQVGGIEIDVTMPSGREETRSTVLTSRAVLPVTLGVVHREGPLGPVRLEARAVHTGTVVVRRSVSLTLVGNRSVLVWMVLSRDCAGVECPAGTCAAGACRDEALRPDELVFYDGTIPSLSIDGGPLPDGGQSFDAGTTFDAGAMVDATPPDAPGVDGGRVDAGPCPEAVEVCNTRDDDCDSRVDEGFMLATDPENCGRCGNACTGPGVASATCEASLCVVTCVAGRGDCTPAAGCETTLGTLTHCLACGDACSGVPAFGAHWTCAPGGCVQECDTNRGNCETTAADCETDLRTDEAHCGMCDRACMPSDRCMGGVCR